MEVSVTLSGYPSFDFSVLQNTKARPSVIPATPHIVTPLSQQGFPLCSSTNQAGPSQNHDVGVVNRDEMPRGFGSETQYVYLYDVSWGRQNPVFLDCGLKTERSYQFWDGVDDKIGSWCSIIQLPKQTSTMIEKSNKFVKETDFHLMVESWMDHRVPYPSWDDVDISVFVD
ncbi:hypothetical protein Tco_1093462 [Tanacetum coccineum]|uniref:Uncharacterized protein n=1 Tax=Tanacetum coccineum TaxID=301880 RepID=A0ABQ5ICR3_9ASTR